MTARPTYAYREVAAGFDTASAALVRFLHAFVATVRTAVGVIGDLVGLLPRYAQ